MGAQLLSSKIVILEEEPRIGSITALPTAVLGAVGVAERGPLSTPTLATSFEEYSRIFGGFTVDSDLSLAAFMFFLNGGELMWVTRTVHHTDVTSSATQIAIKATDQIDQSVGATSTKGSVTSGTSEPWDLEPGQTVLVNDEVGLDGTGTFNATAALVPGAAGSFAAMASETMEVQFENGPVQLVTFGTEATQAAAVNILNSQLSGGRALVNGANVDIESDLRGTSSRVRTSNVAAGVTTKLGIPDAADISGTGNVADIDNVTAAEAAAIIDAALTDVTATAVAGSLLLERDTSGSANSVQVDAGSTAVDFAFDNAVHAGTDSSALPTLQADGRYYGAYGNNLASLIENATSGAADEFNLSIIDTIKDRVLEVFPNLTMDAAELNYIETVVNDVDTGSLLLAYTDQLLPGTAAQKRPANGTHALASGDNGLTGLADTDFIGSAAGGTGIRSLDTVQNITLLIIPGQTSSAIHLAIVDYCEVVRDKTIFGILDPPTGTSAAAMAALMDSSGLRELSEFGAIYWPEVKILNPNKDVFGTGADLQISPSGAIAGMYARTDSARPGGIYDPPAGVERGRLLGVIGIEETLGGKVEALQEEKRDLVFPKLCNPITAFPGSAIHVDGARTLKSTGNFPTIAERRGVVFIETSIKNGILFAKHSNNTKDLRNRIRRTINAFLLLQMKNGAFRSQNPTQAFFVDVSDALNPSSVVFARQLRGRVGLATNKPAEFIILSFSQDTRALEEELAAA